MRKLLLSTLIAAFVAALPLSAVAQVTTSVSGVIWSTFNTSEHVGTYAGTLADDFNDKSVNFSDTRTYSYTRTIPTITLKFSDDLSYILNIDTLPVFWGNEPNVAGSVAAGTSTTLLGGGNSGYGFGAYTLPGSINLHLRNSFVDFRIPTTPARLKIGLQLFTDAANNTIWVCHCPGIRLDSPLGKGTATFIWSKIGEGRSGAVGAAGIVPNDWIDNDADVFAARVTYPVAEGITITPQWYFLNGDDAHTCVPACIDGIGFQGKQIHWLGANLKGTIKTGIAPLTFDVNIIGATGDYDERAGADGAMGTIDDVLVPTLTAVGLAGGTGDYSASLFETRATMDFGTIKPGIIFLFSSGDDNRADADRELFPSINAYYLANDLFFVGKTGLTYMSAVTNSPSGQMFRSRPGIPTTANGITMFQVNAAIKPLKNLTVTPAISFMRASEPWGATVAVPGVGVSMDPTATDMGINYGVEFDYYIYKNLRWHTYVGAFAPGDFYKFDRDADGIADDPATAVLVKSIIGVFF